MLTAPTPTKKLAVLDYEEQKYELQIELLKMQN